MRVTFAFVVAGLALTAAGAVAQEPAPRVVVRERAPGPDAMPRVAGRAYQGRNNGPEQTDRFSRKVKIGRDGRVSVQNISGDITVTAGGGDEVSIEAVKRTRGDHSQLASVHIDVDERSGRVDVRTTHTANNDRVSVDYTIVVPASASVDVKSVSGNLKVSGAHGVVRGETVSGSVTTTDTPQLEYAKSVSGDVSLSGVATDGDLTAGSVSGNITAKGVKARGLDLGSVSGDVNVSEVTCERLTVKSVSGNVEYGGGIAKGGRYEINSHSGDVRLALRNPAGFELNASSFSGTIRSELPMTTGGGDSDDRGNRGRRRDGFNNHSMHATFGDGSATVTVRTFSGSVVISKR
ncbi:MAG TPA: DUF4097 family beta strand repeat-containing protein [Vicinamibacterales bacterium]|jgi:DUF4097 and DUF4098 domain-containing protein YvlB|nr:DUF4097 family beta strand repeat-containing protein [Vicinamibacterales bacterium]